MKRRWARITAGIALWLLLGPATVPLTAAGAFTFDGAADFLDCGSVDFDGVDWAAVIAWVTPNFDSTNTADQTIITNINAGATAGFRLRWSSGSTFSFQLRRSSGGCCTVQVTPGAFPGAAFSAGDLLGIYAGIDENAQQQITVFNARTGGVSSSSAFNSFTYNPASDNTIIGANTATTGDFWDGDIHQIILTNTALFNTNTRHLPSVKKQTFYPFWAVSTSEQAGETFVDYVAGWNFEFGNDGDTLAASTQVLWDITGNANHCTTGSGTAIVATGTPMLR